MHFPSVDTEGRYADWFSLSAGNYHSVCYLGYRRYPATFIAYFFEVALLEESLQNNTAVTFERIFHFFSNKPL